LARIPADTIRCTVHAPKIANSCNNKEQSQAKYRNLLQKRQKRISRAFGSRSSAFLPSSQSKTANCKSQIPPYSFNMLRLLPLVLLLTLPSLAGPADKSPPNLDPPPNLTL